MAEKYITVSTRKETRNQHHNYIFIQTKNGRKIKQKYQPEDERERETSQKCGKLSGSCLRDQSTNKRVEEHEGKIGGIYIPFKQIVQWKKRTVY